MRSPDMRPNPGVPTEPSQAVMVAAGAWGVVWGALRSPIAGHTCPICTAGTCWGTEGPLHRAACHEGDLDTRGEHPGPAELMMGTPGIIPDTAGLQGEGEESTL